MNFRGPRNMQWTDIISLLLLAVVIAAIIYAFFGSESFLVSDEELSSDIENISTKTPPKNLGPAPDITSIVNWINTEPLTSQDLQGKVVLIDFWTYSCINCIRTLPFVQSWHEEFKDDGFVLIGVHSPEFEFEKNINNVSQAANKYGITYPIAIDNDHATWNAFRNRYWPAHYLIDVNGDIRYVHFGEGKYAETKQAIQQLLVEAGLLAETKDDDTGQASAPADRQVGTPEIYFGYDRLEYLGNTLTSAMKDKATIFSAPPLADKNTFYLDGEWSIGPEAAELTGNEGAVLINFSAQEANMVLEPVGDKPVDIELTLDGKSLTDENRGGDIFLRDGKSYFLVDSSRLYNLVHLPSAGVHTLRISIPNPGIRAYTFTFG